MQRYKRDQIADNTGVHRKTAWRVYKWNPRWRSSVTTAVIRLMMEIVEQIEHPFWTKAVRIEGYESWFSLLDEQMSDGTPIKIRVEFDDPDNEIVQRNFTAIRQRWTDIWPHIQQRTYEMKAAYGYCETPIQSESDWFELKPPTERIETNGEWSVMLQADEAGWLLDFEGWDDAGGQGVF